MSAPVRILTGLGFEAFSQLGMCCVLADAITESRRARRSRTVRAVASVTDRPVSAEPGERFWR